LNAQKPIYFYCSPVGPPEDNDYPHSLLAVAEGLRQLGVPLCSNVDYWKNSPAKDDYLLRHDPQITPDDCSAVVLENGYPRYGGGLPRDLFRKGRSYRTVFFDFHDEYPTSAFDDEYRKFDVIFRAHYSDRLYQPTNFTAWAFGFTNRIVRATEAAPPASQRKQAVLVSYRVPHGVRTRSNELFLKRLSPRLPIVHFEDGFKPSLSDPYDQLHWHQTGRRHNPAFYASLADSAACACFGGSLVNPILASRFSPLGIWQRVRSRMRQQPFSYTLTQWDSFRLWESWAAGCATFHLDLEKYGAVLPVMPKNWEHYVGIDLNRPEVAVDRIKSDQGILQRVAANGRAWALEHYSPMPVAKRFVRTVFG
jgi:hypothetical protein